MNEDGIRRVVNDLYLSSITLRLCVKNQSKVKRI